MLCWFPLFLDSMILGFISLFPFVCSSDTEAVAEEQQRLSRMCSEPLQAAQEQQELTGRRKPVLVR